MYCICIQKNQAIDSLQQLVDALRKENMMTDVVESLLEGLPEDKLQVCKCMYGSATLRLCE